MSLKKGERAFKMLKPYFFCKWTSPDHCYFSRFGPVGQVHLLQRQWPKWNAAPLHWQLAPPCPWRRRRPPTAPLQQREWFARNKKSGGWMWQWCCVFCLFLPPGKIKKNTGGFHANKAFSWTKYVLGHTLMPTLEWKTQARWWYVWQRKVWHEPDWPI